VSRVIGANKLLEIWLDGYCSGINTAACRSGMPEDEAHALAYDECHSIQRDPIAIEQLKAEVLERINGVDTGPKTIRTYG
jgi:hypothetical protein